MEHHQWGGGGQWKAKGCPLRQVRAGCEHEEEDIYGLRTQAPMASGGVGLPEGDS